MGAKSGHPGAYAVVSTDAASPGRVTVGAKKAVDLLGSVAVEGDVEDLDLEPASADAGLAAFAEKAASGPSGGFRTASGQGILAMGMPGDAADIAAVASACWDAALACRSGLQRILLLGGSKTIGMAMADQAGALVVAAFAAGMNPGLAGTETAKLVKACDQAAAGGAS
jgi:hypothetical protein